MSDTNAPEPTMEEILASIRRIISEDDAPAPAAEETTTSPADPPEPAYAHAEPEPPPAAYEDRFAADPPFEEEVLELTERLEPEPEPAHGHGHAHGHAHAHGMQADGLEPSAPSPRAGSGSLGDLDFAAPPSAPEPPGHAGHPAHSGHAAHKEPPPRPAPPPPSAPEEPLVGSGAAGRAADHFGALASTLLMPAEGRTLEDVVRELLRPMLKTWLDEHLAGIVEARVQDEVERISRRRTY